MTDTAKKPAPAKKAPAKKAPARTKAARETKDAKAAPENKVEETAEPALDPALAQDIAVRAAKLAKTPEGDLDVQAELIAINRKLEALAAAANVALPSR